MATDQEKMIISLEARQNALEKEMKKASGTVEREFGKMERRAKVSASRMEATMAAGATRMGGAMKNFAVGLVAGMLSGSAAINGARQALEQFSKVQDAANATGLDSEFLQEVAYQAEQGGVGFDQLSAALESFAKNSGLAVAGKGKMTAALKALNPELLANIKAATSQEERVRLAADAIDKAGSASEAAALSSALFADAGTRLVEVFQGGPAAMDAFAAKARDLGLVVDRDLIAKSEQLGDELSTVTQIMDLQFKKTLVELGPLLVTTTGAIATMAEGVGKLGDMFKYLDDQSGRSLDSQIAKIGQERLAIETSIKQLQSGEKTPGDGIFGTTIGESTPLEAIEALNRQNEALAEQERRILAIIAARQSAPAATKPDTGTPSTIDLGGGGSRNDAADAAIREGQAVKDLITDLQMELATLGLSSAEKEVSNMLRRAGVDAMSKEGQQIAELVRNIEAETAARDEQRRAVELQAQAIDNLFQMGGDALMSIVDKSASAEDAVRRLAVQLALAAAQAALLGSGPLAGLFKGLGGGLGKNYFPPAPIGGGGGVGLFTSPARQSASPPVTAVQRPQLVAPRAPDVRGTASAASSVNFTYAPTINAPNSDAAGLAKVREQMAREKANLPANVIATIREAQKRRML